MSAERTHLLIPIHVDALVVSGGKADAAWAPFKHGTVSVAPDLWWLKTHYKTGADLRNPLDADKKKLEKGIHLHFRLPALIAHGDLNKEHAFPRIPNRWLVQRYYKQANTLHMKTWLVCGDKEAKGKRDTDDPTVVLLVAPADGSPGPYSYRPTGVASVIWDTDKPSDIYDYRYDHTGAEVELTAVTGGDAGFSAHYPACRNILGLHDDLSDLAKLPADANLKLSYHVTGWYSSVNDDPWNNLISSSAGKNWTQLSDEEKTEIENWLDERSCRIALKDKTLPSGILCHGSIQDVSPSGISSTAGPFEDLDQSKDDHWVDIGNTSAEALAARVAKLRTLHTNSQAAYKGDLNLLEDLVTALQSGLFSQGPSAADMDAELHRQGFASLAGGKVWDIQSTPVPSANTQQSPAPVSHPLSADLQKQLDALNQLERECGRHERLLRDYRWELYALWHRWTEAKRLSSKTRQNLLQPAIDAFKKIIPQYDAKLNELWKKRDHEKSQLEQKLPGLSTGPDAGARNYNLVEQPDCPFYAPKDPVLILTGTATQVSGTRPRSASVQARITGEEIQSFRYGHDDPADRTYAASDVAAEIPSGYLAAIPPWSAKLLLETLLLTEADVLTADGSFVDHTKSPGILPDRDVGRFRWEHNPWIPLYLHWSVSWHADVPGAPLPHEWTLRHGDNDSPQYRRNADLVASKKLPGTAIGQKAGEQVQFTGLSFAGDPLFNLQFSQAQGDLRSLMNQIVELMGSRSSAMISQALGGVQDAFMTRRDGDQLPPFDYDQWKNKANPGLLYLDSIRQVLGKDFHPLSSPMTPYPRVPGSPLKPLAFSPLRSGLLQVVDLWVIDAFGQRIRIEPKTLASSCQSGRLAVENGPAFRLHPRFCRPMRLEFTSTSTDDADAICGWVVQNRFDQNLVLYSTDGHPVGILQKRFADAGTTMFYWVAVPGTHGAQATVDGIQNPYLRDFAKFVLSRNFETGRAFDQLMNSATESTQQRMPEDNQLLSVLLGRPLALVRAQLRLETDGLPALNQENSWTEAAKPGEIEAILTESMHSGAAPAPNKFMETSNVEKARWQLRLGDRRGANDGLVGFFKEGPSSRTFYTSWGFDLGNRAQTYDGLEAAQDLVLDCDSTLQVTLLMDPQARVHVTSGVLPRMSLELTNAQLKGLKQVREVFFQTAPVLGTATTPHVPTPSDDYGQWSWTYRPNVTGWAEDPSMASATVLAGQSVNWPTLTEGWLKLKTEPILIRSLWVKAPVEQPQRKGNVTLAWSLHGADIVALYQLRPDGTEDLKEKWSESAHGSDKSSLGSEWTSYVETHTRFRLKATSRAGCEDSKDIEIQIEE